MSDTAKLPEHEAAPAPLPAFAAKANDLEALRNAVVDAAGVGAGLWFSYLFVLLYLVIAVGGVTHRNLLLESPVKLPFLNVDLPLIGFFVLGPILFLIVHAYILLHFVLLAGKVGAFHAELRTQIADESVRTRLRRQLPSNIFVQFLAGPVEVRSGLVGAMLRLIALISLVLGPIALLVFFQIQFLPYQHELITWWHRLLIVADLALLWALWPSVARGEITRITWRDLRGVPVAAIVASLAPLLLVFTIATFPGEWLHGNPVKARFIPSSGYGLSYGSWQWITPHEFLVAGDVDLIARKPTSPWSNRLVLPSIDVPPGTLSLRGRRLEGAVLASANLQQMDFTAAQLRDAIFDDADLREAKFECGDSKVTFRAGPIEMREGESRCTQLEGASFMGAKLQGAQFERAQLQGAKLKDANLRNAMLDHAQLKGAILTGARMHGASLEFAELHGATLDHVILQGAVLEEAQLQGASLSMADLRGASLERAFLYGASLDDADLSGAWFSRADLQGASLNHANLRGASLDFANLRGAWLARADLRYASLVGTQLQGVTLQQAKIEGANFDYTFVWRSDARAAVWRSDDAQATKRVPRATDLHTGPVYSYEFYKESLEGCSIKQPCAWTTEKYRSMLELFKGVPEGEPRIDLMRRVRNLDLDPAGKSDDEEESARHWAELAQLPVSAESYNSDIAKEWQRIGCAAEGAPFIARGLISNLDGRFKKDEFHRRLVADTFLNEARCAGARGLSEKDKTRLQELAAEDPKEDSDDPPDP